MQHHRNAAVRRRNVKQRRSKISERRLRLQRLLESAIAELLMRDVLMCGTGRGSYGLEALVEPVMGTFNDFPVHCTPWPEDTGLSGGSIGATWTFLIPKA